jgi:hypothetical protein
MSSPHLSHTSNPPSSSSYSVMNTLVSSVSSSNLSSTVITGMNESGSLASPRQNSNTKEKGPVSQANENTSFLEKFRQKLTHLVGLREGILSEPEPTHPESTFSTPLESPLGTAETFQHNENRSYASGSPIGESEYPPACEESTSHIAGRVSGHGYNTNVSQNAALLEGLRNETFQESQTELVIEENVCPTFGQNLSSALSLGILQDIENSPNTPQSRLTKRGHVLHGSRGSPLNFFHFQREIYMVAAVGRSHLQMAPVYCMETGNICKLSLIFKLKMNQYKLRTGQMQVIQLRIFYAVHFNYIRCSYHQLSIQMHCPD